MSRRTRRREALADALTMAWFIATMLLILGAYTGVIHP